MAKYMPVTHWARFEDSFEEQFYYRLVMGEGELVKYQIKFQKKSFYLTPAELQRFAVCTCLRIVNKYDKRHKVFKLGCGAKVQGLVNHKNPRMLNLRNYKDIKFTRNFKRWLKNAKS